MKAALLLSVIASTAVGLVAAAEELKIDVTTKVNCDRKTQKGDKVFMHYRGTLDTGKQFDASTLCRTLIFFSARETPSQEFII